MAVKKATAKKSAPKKAVAKKSTVKKAVAKKSPAKPVKKAAIKKSAAKKTVAKKPSAKKTVVKKAAAKPVKKSAVKKSAAKKTVAKKAPAKKSAAKKSAASKSSTKFIVPALPVTTPRSSRVEVPAAPISPPAVISSAPAIAPAPVAKQSTSGRVIFAVVVGIALIILVVWSKSSGDDTKSSSVATPKATASAMASESMSEVSTPTPEETQASEEPVAVAAHEPPKNAVGNYTAEGLRLTWSAPDATDGLTGYNIEISKNGGAMEMFSTLPATQTSLDLMKSDTSGWTSFRISSVYSDDATASVKAFGFPGQFS